jgi:hypothetical protein
MTTKLQKSSSQNSKSFDLLAKMSEQAFTETKISEEEQLRRMWEEMCKRLDRSQLKCASVNYDLWCSKQKSPNQLKIA